MTPDILKAKEEKNVTLEYNALAQRREASLCIFLLSFLRTDDFEPRNIKSRDLSITIILLTIFKLVLSGQFYLRHLSGK